jgi:hypothetical protein
MNYKHSNFDLLLQAYCQGKTSPTETYRINVFLKRFKNLKDTFMDLTRTEEEYLYQLITSKKNTVPEIKRFKPSRLIKKNYHNCKLKVQTLFLSRELFADNWLRLN